MFCLANCCRLCLSKDSTVVEYTCLASDNVSYLNKLIDIVPKLITDTGTYYPTGICKKCQEQVDQIYNFIQECFKSKEILSTYINQLNHATMNMITLKSDNCFKAEGHTLTEMPIPLSTSNTIFIANQLIKEEVDIEDNPLFNNSFDMVLKQEEIDLDDHMSSTEFVFTAIKNESHNMITDATDSIPCNEEEGRPYNTEEYSHTDDSVSSSEYEPIRKNEKTPRLKRYKCLKCAKKFSRHSHLLRHSRVHTGNRPYPCLICNKSFTLLENLERHQVIHADNKPHTCTHCNKSFNDKSYLKKHIQLHEGLRYTCDVCNKSFSKSCRLIVHKRKHTGERPFECSLCKITYADPDTLRRHRKKCEIKRITDGAASNENCAKHTNENSLQTKEIM